MEPERLIGVAAVIWALQCNMLTEQIRRLAPAAIWPHLERAVSGDHEALEVVKAWVESQGDLVRLH